MCVRSLRKLLSCLINSLLDETNDEKVKGHKRRLVIQICVYFETFCGENYEIMYKLFEAHGQTDRFLENKVTCS